MQYAPGAKSLKMNSIIYAEENATTKKLNKQVPCGYSINVVTSHNNESKQTYYRVERTVATFCKEIRDIAKNLLNIEKEPIEKLSSEQEIPHINAKYCHICKKVFDKKKNHIIKFVIMTIIQVNIEVLYI